MNTAALRGGFFMHARTLSATENSRTVWHDHGDGSVTIQKVADGLRPESARVRLDTETMNEYRDAVHDYSLGRHRRARTKAALAGELTRLPGIGPELARRLFERFGSLKAMADADADTLRAVPGVGKARAGQLAARLRALAGGDK